MSENEEQLSSKDSNVMYIIVGAASGGVVSAVMALACLAMKRMRAVPPLPSGGGGMTANSATAALHDDPEMAVVGSNNGNSRTFRLGPSSEIILIQNQDYDVDVSTLGDPVGGMTMTTTATGTQYFHYSTTGDPDADEQTASVENDYDYTKLTQYSLGDSAERISMSDGTTGASMEIQYDNDTSRIISMGARFEVCVPPGKLGMVIDTPNGGVPVVHAIRADSILASQNVRVGDKLIFVDGDDVTVMTAMQVSKLISLKSDQPRVLVFVRAATSLTSMDHGLPKFPGDEEDDNVVVDGDDGHGDDDDDVNDSGGTHVKSTQKRTPNDKHGEDQ